jgi:hypothetical protein
MLETLDLAQNTVTILKYENVFLNRKKWFPIDAARSGNSPTSPSNICERPMLVTKLDNSLQQLIALCAFKDHKNNLFLPNNPLRNL